MEKALFASWERHEIIAPCYSAPLSPLNPALLLYLPPINTPPPLPWLSPPCLSPQHTHLHNLTVLFIDDSSLPFLSGYTVNTETLAPRGPNGLISTVYSCALSRMTHKGTKRPLCAKELFLSSSTGPTDAHCTFLRKPTCISSFDKFVIFFPGYLSARPLSLTIPVFHPFIYKKFFLYNVTCHHFYPEYLLPTSS